MYCLIISYITTYKPKRKHLKINTLSLLQQQNYNNIDLILTDKNHAKEGTNFSQSSVL